MKILREFAVNFSDYGGIEFWLNRPLYSLEGWAKLINQKVEKIKKAQQKK